jgi:hypothetical protein
MSRWLIYVYQSDWSKKKCHSDWSNYVTLIDQVCHSDWSKSVTVNDLNLSKWLI